MKAISIGLVALAALASAAPAFAQLLPRNQTPQTTGSNPTTAQGDGAGQTGTAEKPKQHTDPTGGLNDNFNAKRGNNPNKGKFGEQ